MTEPPVGSGDASTSLDRPPVGSGDASTSLDRPPVGSGDASTSLDRPPVGPRVLELLGPSTGGIRRHVAFLAEALRGRGWTIATAGPEGVLDGLGPQDHAVPIPSGLAPTAIPAAWWRLRRLLRDYDLVHAHGLTAGWLAALARTRRRTALVVTVHNLVLDAAAGRSAALLRALERRLPARADRVIAVSPAIAAYLEAGGAGRDRVVVVGALGPPPVPVRSAAETRDALGVDVDTPLVVCVARLHPQKGLDVLLAAVPALAAAVPRVRVAIVGQGPLEGALRGQAVAAGVTEHVIFAPPKNPADELRAADVVVVPSRWESGPLVLSEAMLLGRPVVATPVGTVTDLLVDGDTGWLVAVEDPDALAAALGHVLRDPAEAGRRAAAGQARAAAVSADERVSLVEDNYRASLGRP